MSQGRRGGTSEQGRIYRQAGHDNALLFALFLGLDEDYQRDKRAKKDVIDPAHDAHSVKSGEKKWQVFLYRRSRFATNHGFKFLNGIGQLLLDCIDAFPPEYTDYEQNKTEYKRRLQVPMRTLKDRFQDKELVKAFLSKSIFNSGEVNYLTIFQNDLFHVYWHEEIVEVLGNNLTVVNSTSSGNNPDSQKVVFKYKGRNTLELEIRKSGRNHYREGLLHIMPKPFLELLRCQILTQQTYPNVPILSHGDAISRFWKW